MKQRRLGSGGPSITTVGLGTWAMGGPYEWGWGPSDDRESEAALSHGLDAGINWIDTAPAYGRGHAEEVVGRVLRRHARADEVFVFTKCGLDASRLIDGRLARDLRPDTIRTECEQSLRRLNVDRIDVFQIHWPDTMTGTAIEDSWATMGELVDEGKVRWIGVSNFEVPLIERCNAMRRVDSCQPILNLLNRAAAHDVVPWARSHDAGVIAYSPLASGLLSGKYGRDIRGVLAPDDWRLRSPEFTEPKLTLNLALIEHLRHIAREAGVTLPTLAIAWVLAVEGVTGAIVGSRRPSQIDDWIAAASWTLPDGARADIDTLLESTGAGAGAR